MRKTSTRLRRIRANEPMPVKADSEPIPGYRLLQVRGSGGFGTVWEAVGKFDKRIALKFLANRKGLQVVQEIRNLQSLQKFDHPHLLQVRNIWCHCGYIILGMDLADGSLADLLEVSMEECGKPLHAQTLSKYFVQAASAIDYLNGLSGSLPPGAHRMQHCDIKPTNLLLFGDSIKVADFGLSQGTSCGDHTSPHGYTRRYCAPELLHGRVSLHSDQFALAVSYYQLRTGEFPFEENPDWNQPAKLSLVTTPEQAVLRRALDYEPHRRWPSCVTFANALDRCLQARSSN